MSRHVFSLSGLVFLACLLLAITGTAAYGQTPASTPALPTPTSTSGEVTPSQATGTTNESGADSDRDVAWIERIPAWQVIGTILLVAFVVLLTGIVWLRWIRPGDR